MGQVADSLTPSAISPKQMSKSKPGTEVASPRNPGGDNPLVPDNPGMTIKGIIIVKSASEVQATGVPKMRGVVVKDVPFLQRRDFTDTMDLRFLGRPLTENSIRDLQDAIILYCRERGKLVVDVVLPEQAIDNGVLQVWVLEGNLGQVVVKNPGREWFKQSYILEQIHLRPGQPIDSQQLNKDLNWLNNNPFREVNAAFRPSTNLGITDIELQVADRFPVRPYVGYENSGTIPTGEDRLLVGLNWGNVFGLDHQLNYQYATDTSFELVQAHSASYIAPLPWHNTLTVFGSYVNAKADFGAAGTTADGTSWQTSMRYGVPLPESKTYRHEISAGFDFKRSDNNLLAGGDTVLQNTDTDIAQFVLSYSGLLSDPWGRTTFGIELYYSPGNWTTFNNDTDFNSLRVDAKANYMYGRLNLERLTRLPYNFSWVLRGWAQSASDRLLPSEELGVGGFSTVRGYDERVALGDKGWILDNELRTPPLVPASWVGLPWRDELQFLAFLDYGAVRIVNLQPADGNDPESNLCSVGLGLRYTVGRNLSVRFDYGFPLSDKYLNAHSSRGHIGALLSF
jgi:hemolysin activation/secretion protein